MRGFSHAMLTGYLIILGAVWQSTPARANDFDQQRAQSAQRYSVRLAELAAWCDDHQLAEQAAQTRAWHVQRDPYELVIPRLPQAANALQGNDNGPSLIDEWRKRFYSLRIARAEELFAEAGQAMQAGRVSLAFEMLPAVLGENPDHAAARKILGYQRHGDRWLTPFALARERSGQVWHDRFGWIPKRLVARYEAGERFHKGRAISAEQDARLHASVDTGWEVETEHFRITTNHSLETAARTGKRLEEMAEVWELLMAGYRWSSSELTKMFDGGGPPVRAQKRHDVVVFRDESEYRRALSGEIPQQVRTTGIYISRRRTAYFFVDAAAEGTVSDDSTLFHEAVHQLFSESRKGVASPGREKNFWVIEGIACYFESLAGGEQKIHLGGRSAIRLQNARFRALEDGFYRPLEQLCALGMDGLQRDANIAALYSQSAGLTHFLIHYDGGRYRDALVEYLLAIYTGRDRPTTLAELTGTDFDELDRQYRQFLKESIAE